jgi:DNA recombination protein RmuC
VGLFLKSFNEMGKNLEKVKISYTEAKKKLIPQGKSIVNTCDKLEKLGAKQNPKHPITRFDEIEELEA